MAHHRPAALLRAEAAGSLAAESVLALEAALPELASRRRAAAEGTAAHFLLPVHPPIARAESAAFFVLTVIETTAERLGTSTAVPHPLPIVASTVVASGERSAPEGICSLLCEPPAASFRGTFTARLASGHRAASAHRPARHRVPPHSGMPLALAGSGDLLPQRGQKIFQARQDRVRRIGPNLATPLAAEAAAAAHHSPALSASITGLIGLALLANVFLPAAESARPSAARAAALARI